MAAGKGKIRDQWLDLSMLTTTTAFIANSIWILLIALKRLGNVAHPS
jgi:hypothetical protein